MKCAYGPEQATHRGEGEDVCEEHIYPAACAEYVPIEVSA